MEDKSLKLASETKVTGRVRGHGRPGVTPRWNEMITFKQKNTSSNSLLERLKQIPTSIHFHHRHLCSRLISFQYDSIIDKSKAAFNQPPLGFGWLLSHTTCTKGHSQRQHKHVGFLVGFHVGLHVRTQWTYMFLCNTIGYIYLISVLSNFTSQMARSKKVLQEFLMKLHN